jgi:dTDP-4-dehydrorhamnose 3,5-epimerase
VSNHHLAKGLAMNFIKTKLSGVIIIEPDVHRDPRGFFLETYHQKKYVEAGIPGPFVQDNHSKSTKGILRGLHAQRSRPQGKLVRVLQGKVFDVAVDIRRSSPTFALWVGVALSSDDFKQIFVPPGYAHGFVVLSDTAEVEYKCTDLYDPADEIRLLWNDPQIKIDWPIKDPILSDKDRNAQTLQSLSDHLPVYR